MCENNDHLFGLGLVGQYVESWQNYFSIALNIICQHLEIDALKNQVNPFKSDYSFHIKHNIYV